MPIQSEIEEAEPALPNRQSDKNEDKGSPQEITTRQRIASSVSSILKMPIQYEIEEAEPASPNRKSDSLGRMNKNEDKASLQEITKIQENLSTLRDLLNKEGEQKIAEQPEQFASQHRKICSMIQQVNADIEKIINTLSQYQSQQKSLTNQSKSEERQELSELEMKILENQVMKNLQVSFSYLQRPNLKYCLVFLSIFPENAVIRKRPLIYWWIGESLISTEKEGEEIFEALLKLELIIPFVNGKNPFVSKCRIHPWIRYLLISLAKDAGLLNFDSKGVPRFDIINSRRACLVTDDENLPQTEPNLRTNISNVSESKNDLRTIFNVNQSYVSFKSKLLGNQEKLAVLMLGRWQDLSTHHIEVENEQWLKELRTQKHLKHLSLRGISRITALPDSILEHTCLEIFDLKACHNLETLPDDISPLKKLTHLDVSECYLLESMPKGLDKLTSLQVLKGFVIGNSKKTPCRIHDLGKLKKLKRLSIHIGSEAVIQPGEFNLEGLESVTHLKISWGTHKEQIVKESFSFPPKLDKLDFEGFPHGELPDWFRKSNLNVLKKLYIKGGKLKSLEHQREVTWQVEILRLHHLKNLQIEFENWKNLFPSLRYAQVLDEERNEEKIYSYTLFGTRE